MELGREWYRMAQMVDILDNFSSGTCTLGMFVHEVRNDSIYFMAM
jgi:hypothetical protein